MAKGRSDAVRRLSLEERLSQAADILISDQEYRGEYEQFVVAMSYARDDEKQGFDDAVSAYRWISQTVIS